MATPLTGTTEWAGTTTDGPAATSVIARNLEKFAVLRFASAADRTAKFTTAGYAAVKGMVCCLDDDATALYKFNGTTWLRFVPSASRDSGSVSISFAASVDSGAATVTFSTSFSAAPSVVTQVNTAAGGGKGVTTRVYNVTTSGFTVIGFAPSTITATIALSWTADGS